MSKIKQLDVSLKISVGLGDLIVSTKVLEQLKEIEEKDLTLSQIHQQEYPEAYDWLGVNIKDTDAYEWEYEINELSI